MADALLAGVGSLDYFDSDDNLILSSKVATTSGIEMGITGEEARGGSGNILVGKYYHDSSFNINFESIVYNMQYLALNCGGAITAGSDVLTIEQQTVTSGGKITVSQTPVAFTSEGKVIGWWKKSTQDDTAFVKFEFDSGAKTATLEGATEHDIVCVKYVINNSSARKFVVNADYIPSVGHAIMTIGLYKAGTTKETLSNSSKIGNLIVDVPNFQLAGAQSLSLSSTGFSTTSLTGSALATFGVNSGCSDHGYYAIITEDIFNAGEFDNVKAIVVANSDIELSSGETETLKVYKMYADGTQPSLVSPSKLTFTSSQSSYASVGSHTGVVTASGNGKTTIEIIVTDKPELSATAQVEVTA